MRRPATLDRHLINEDEWKCDGDISRPFKKLLLGWSFELFLFMVRKSLQITVVTLNPYYRLICPLTFEIQVR